MFPGVLQRLPLSVCLCCSLCTPVSASQKHPRMMLIDCWKLHSFRSTIFLTASQKVTLSERKVNHPSQQGDATGGLQDFSSPSTSRRAPKKRKKQRQGQYIAPGQNTLHVGAAVSYRENQVLAILANHEFNALRSNAVNR